jgi:ABC-type uncharacterized transport system fused permease/ATPase subunit
MIASQIEVPLLYCLYVPAAGKKSSGFYQIFLDKDDVKFRETLLILTAYYTGTAAALVASTIVCQCLSILWRARLTRALHNHYFDSDMFFHISSTSKPAPQLGGPYQESYGTEQRFGKMNEQSFVLSSNMLGGHGRRVNSLEETTPDNPDQRITDEVNLFCQSLSTFLQKCSEAPITFIYYSYLCCTLFRSLLPLVAATVFFVVCAIFHRFIVGALAAAVYAQEKAEGDFRSVHTRIRDQAASIAAWGGAETEHAYAEQSLNSLLKRQLWLMLCYSAQKLVSKV